jgi:hypothetical protein
LFIKEGKRWETIGSVDYQMVNIIHPKLINHAQKVRKKRVKVHHHHHHPQLPHPPLPLWWEARKQSQR